MSDKQSIPDLQQAQRRFEAVGMSPDEAAGKARLLAQAAAAFGDPEAYRGRNWRAFYVPGRLECLGKHTDYVGGRSLVCPIERGFCLVSVARQDQLLRIIDAGSGQTAKFAVSPDLVPSAGHWSNYPMTVARRIARNFPGSLRGADVALASDLSRDAGMSSSSALVIAAFLAIASVNELAHRPEYVANIDSPESLASYLATVENGQSFGSLLGDKGVGTFGGSEDHTAIICGKAGHLSCYSYCPVRLERTVPLPGGYVFGIASSGVTAAKTGAAREKYNRASNLASAGLHVWNQTMGRNDPHLTAALAGSNEAAKRIRESLGRATHADFTSRELLNRFEHFLAESEQIIPAAIEALAGQDLDEFGRQVDRSQELGETLLGNQVPNTVFLAKIARDLGALAASAFGAGFGGAVWALLREDTAEEFLNTWSTEYSKAFPPASEKAKFFLTRPGPAAMCVASSAGNAALPLL